MRSGMFAGLAMLGTDALTGCSWEAGAGFAVWASAVKADGECWPTCHAAAAKNREEIPAMMRTDEMRKRSSAKNIFKLDAIVDAGFVGR